MPKQTYTCGCGLVTHAGPMKRHKQQCPWPFTIERIFEVCRVEVGGPDECWPATFNLNHGGYPRTYNKQRNRTRASRVVVEIVTGQPVPPNLKVMHTCDNPPCLNPAHLKAGTQAENMRDMHDKGRGKFDPLTLRNWQGQPMYELNPEGEIVRIKR